MDTVSSVNLSLIESSVKHYYVSVDLQCKEMCKRTRIQCSQVLSTCLVPFYLHVAVQLIVEFLKSDMASIVVVDDVFV